MSTVLTLILVGAILLLLETILPGLVAGFLGMCCLVGGVVMGYTHYGLAIGTWILLAVSLGLLCGFGIWLKYFPGSRFAGLFISRRTVGELKVEKPELLDQIGTA